MAKKIFVEKDFRPNVEVAHDLGQVHPADFANSLPVPPTWAATFGINADTYWREEKSFLTPCERDDDA